MRYTKLGGTSSKTSNFVAYITKTPYKTCKILPNRRAVQQYGGYYTRIPVKYTAKRVANVAYKAQYKNIGVVTRVIG